MRWVDSDNTNAQSLNAREIAMRLDTERFECTLFYERDPDPRLKGRPNIRLIRVHPRLQTWILLREMLRGPDIVSYVSPSTAAYLFLCLPRMFRKGVVTVHHAEAPLAQAQDAGGWSRFLGEGVRARCEMHSAITEFVRQDLAKEGIHAQVVLPVGVDTRLFRPPTARTNSKPAVLFVGTLIERKGAHLVIEAAKMFPRALFRLVGADRGGFAVSLRARCASEGIENVEFLGQQSQGAMIEIMQASDIFLLPSRLEGLPKVTLEASAMGMPSLVFDDYHTPSVVDGVTGFQVKTFDEMIERLGLLIRDADLRHKMGEAATHHVKAFDWDVIARTWQEFFETIVDERIAEMSEAQ